MRKIAIKAEMPTPSHVALVFFALALDEQLFDLTDDSFKAPALNTYTRTKELQNVALANHSAGISREALKPFIEELEASIGKDAALSSKQKALCGFHIASINENLSESDRIARGVSGLRAVMGEYLELVQSAIEKTILNEPQNKADLLSLTSAFIVQAEHLGYPRRHTFYVTQNSLIRALKHSRHFDPNDLLKSFFSFFKEEKENYQCLFIVSENFNEYPKLLQKFGIKIMNERPEWPGVTKDQEEFLSSKKDHFRYALIETPLRRSPALAHKIATSLIIEFVGLVRFHSHKQDFQHSKLALVRSVVSEKIYRIHEDPDPMHCWVSHGIATEDEMLDIGEVTHGKLLTESSAIKIRRTLRLHRSALISNSAENQLIDLWAGLEGLVSRPGKESQRIDYFSECLLPALTLSYPEKLFTSAFNDLCRIVPESRFVMLTLPGVDNEFSKFVRVVLCQENKKALTNLVELVASNPLLMNRLWRLQENFKSRAATQKTLRNHRKKVRWHLSRIYHTRNSIMHSARHMAYLPTLVENLHVYVDTLIKSICKVALISSERQGIDGILQYLSAWERYRLSSLTSEGGDIEAALSEDVVWDVVFGVDMALTPEQQSEE